MSTGEPKNVLISAPQQGPDQAARMVTRQNSIMNKDLNKESSNRPDPAAELRSLKETASSVIRESLSAELYFPEDAPDMLKYKRYFSFFKPPMLKTDGKIKKDIVCLECFKRNPVDLKLFKSSKLGLYNHLRDKHLSAFKEFQHSLQKNGSSSRSTPRSKKNKRELNALLNVEDSLFLQSINGYGRTRKPAVKQPVAVRPTSDSASVSTSVKPTVNKVSSSSTRPTTVVTTTKKRKRVLQQFNLADSDDEDDRFQQQKTEDECNVQLVRMMLSVGPRMMQKQLTDPGFGKFLTCLKPNKSTYKLPSLVMLSNLQENLSFYLRRKFEDAMSSSNKSFRDLYRMNLMGFFSLVLAMNRSSTSHCFSVSLNFYNHTTKQVERWRLIDELLPVPHPQMDIRATLLNVLQAFKIDLQWISHIYCNSEGFISRLGESFPALKLLESSISESFSELLNLTDYAKSYGELFVKIELLWSGNMHQINQVIDDIRTESMKITDGLFLPRLIGAMLIQREKNKLMPTLFADSHFWHLIEQIYTVLYPFHCFLKAFRNFSKDEDVEHSFCRSFFVPWLFYIKKYLLRSHTEPVTFRLTEKGFSFIKSVQVSYQPACILSQVLEERLDRFLMKFLDSSSMSHLLVFTAVDPRTNTFFSMKCCPPEIKTKVTKLILSLLQNLVSPRNQEELTREVEAYFDCTVKEGVPSFGELFYSMEAEQPFHWLDKHRQQFPNMYLLAMRFLPFSFTSVDFEANEISPRSEEELPTILNFLRNNWKMLERKTNIKGFSSLITAMNYELSGNQSPLPVADTHSFNSSLLVLNNSN